MKSQFFNFYQSNPSQLPTPSPSPFKLKTFQFHNQIRSQYIDKLKFNARKQLLQKISECQYWQKYAQDALLQQIKQNQELDQMARMKQVEEREMRDMWENMCGGNQEDNIMKEKQEQTNAQGFEQGNNYQDWCYIQLEKQYREWQI